MPESCANCGEPGHPGHHWLVRAGGDRRDRSDGIYICYRKPGMDEDAPPPEYDD